MKLRWPVAAAGVKFSLIDIRPAATAEVIEVDFLKLTGETRSLRLLVDSGFPS